MLARALMTESELKRELSDYRDRFPRLREEHLFILWFLRAFVTDDDTTAAASLVDGPRDKGVDAVFIDENARVIFIVQGKYRTKQASRSESRSELLSFVSIANLIADEDGAFSSFVTGMSPAARQKVELARARVRERDYRIQLYYVTMGRCSDGLRAEAEDAARRAPCNTALRVIDGPNVLLLLADYLDGVAPPVPSLDLPIEGGRTGHGTGVMDRFDPRTKIESWLFTMNASAVAGLYEQAGSRLFARNVRGFLGSTVINREIESTLQNEPENFWYYNNGITIICDDAQRLSGSGRDILRVSNPQVINGQQTTRTLHMCAGSNSRASVLVRVIRVPREPGGEHFETIVSKTVAATNWQNRIRASDLMSNDRRQVELERVLRNLGYTYIRKRQTKGEVRRTAGASRFLLTKEELAQAVAACELDPGIVRAGKEALFEERLYPKVFSTTDAHFYLCRYWLLKAVNYTAKGFPERGYAKWIVVGFIWRDLASVLRSRAQAVAFREACERQSEVVTHLREAANAVFKVALAFYRKNRGQGDKALDVSSFFKRMKLDREFRSFWNEAGSPARRKFSSAMGRLKEDLAAGD